jgi:cell division protein FtsI (penicillin-binding protein 3)
LNVPHDIDVKVPRLLASKIKDSDLNESSPDRLAEGLEIAPVDMPATKPAAVAAAPVLASASSAAAAAQAETLAPAAGTVVMDVESGLLVPSLIGKPVRAAVELAQEAGFDIDVIGEGVAREQAPPAGSRIAPGGRVAVRFAP